jgi:hypothetical protein
MGYACARFKRVHTCFKTRHSTEIFAFSLLPSYFVPFSCQCCHFCWFLSSLPDLGHLGLALLELYSVVCTGPDGRGKGARRARRGGTDGEEGGKGVRSELSRETHPALTLHSNAVHCTALGAPTQPHAHCTVRLEVKGKKEKKEEELTKLRLRTKVEGVRQ